MHRLNEKLWNKFKGLVCAIEQNKAETPEIGKESVQRAKRVFADDYGADAADEWIGIHWLAAGGSNGQTGGFGKSHSRQ